jgi:hypothetical protein
MKSTMSGQQLQLLLSFGGVVVVFHVVLSVLANDSTTLVRHEEYDKVSTHLQLPNGLVI